MVIHLNIANLPTPIEELPRLTKLLNGPKLFVKRDDLTGLAFGGNKTRKLEFLFAEAESQKAKTIITAGSIQSNHCRQTAAAAARFGMACVLVLNGDGISPVSGNLMLDRLFRAKIIWVKDRSERARVLHKTFDLLSSTDQAPYLIPVGGSNPIGTLGYVFAMEEYISQRIPVDWIIIASSSGGTQAGLVCGARQFNFKGKILGISIDEPKINIQNHVAHLAGDTSTLLENTPYIFKPDEIMVNAKYCKAGYGIYSSLEREAVKIFAEYEGLLLDPVYTGRAAGGLIDLINKGFFKKNERVLFWHTGGQPALFASDYI
jgi:D-cysteine desulfhydrase